MNRSTHKLKIQPFLKRTTTFMVFHGIGVHLWFMIYVNLCINGFYSDKLLIFKDETDMVSIQFAKLVWNLDENDTLTSPQGPRCSPFCVMTSDHCVFCEHTSIQKEYHHVRRQVLFLPQYWSKWWAKKRCHRVTKRKIQDARSFGDITRITASSFPTSLT